MGYVCTAAIRKHAAPGPVSRRNASELDLLVRLEYSALVPGNLWTHKGVDRHKGLEAALAVFEEFWDHALSTVSGPAIG